MSRTVQDRNDTLQKTLSARDKENEELKAQLQEYTSALGKVAELSGKVGYYDNVLLF